MHVHVFPDPEAMAHAAAGAIAQLIRDSDDGPVTLALAGGGTPAGTYAALRHEDVPWSRVHGWVGDERFVPPDHPDNNGTMIRASLMDRVEATFAPVPWRDDWSPTETAAAYEATLVDLLDHDADGPRPDIMLLGMGDDGHTLSLFPGSSALDVTNRWFVETWVESKESWRLTATYPLAHRARHIIFLVAGAAKSEALARVLEPGPRREPLPAARIMDGSGEVSWYVDEAAAASLTSAAVRPESP